MSKQKEKQGQLELFPLPTLAMSEWERKQALRRLGRLLKRGFH